MPTYPSLTTSFEDRMTMHFQEFGEKRLNSQAWPRNPFLDVMEANAKEYKGGEYMTETVKDGYVPTGSAIGEGSTIPVQQVNISLPAMYQPRFVVETCYLDGIRRDKIMTQGSMGPVLNWAEEEANETTLRLRENTAQMLTAAATGTAADGSTNFRTVFDIVKTTGSLGGIDPTQFSWWAGTVNTTAGAWSSTGVARVRTAQRLARRYTGFSGPDLYFASGTTIDAMKAGGYTKETFFRDPRDAKGYDVGDGAYRWSAEMPYDPDIFFDKIPVYYDPHFDAIESSAISTGGILLGVNSKALFLRKKPGYTTQPWQKSENKYGSFMRIIAAGDLIAVNRNSNVLITSIT